MTMTFNPLSELDRIAASVLDSVRTPRLMPVDLYRDGDRYVLHADIPGADPGSIDVDVDGSQLSIRAERTVGFDEGARWITRERGTGSYFRQFTLGDGLALEGITASYDSGVLSVIIPVSERAKPRKIQVESAEHREAINA